MRIISILQKFSPYVEETGFYSIYGFTRTNFLYKGYFNEQYNALVDAKKYDLAQSMKDVLYINLN